MTYCEEEFLQLSGLQHFAFCRRRWALIHLEQQWADNVLTADGTVMHQRAHDSASTESRGDLFIARGVYVFSATLGVSGQCDVVEFRRDPKGVPLPGKSGTWQPYPVEYKRGAPSGHNADALQLCAQALCLEEMLCCPIPPGALYYGTPRRRQRVDFSPELRQAVKEALEEMHHLFRRGHTPKTKPTKACRSCSLQDLCLPQLDRRRSVAAYLREELEY